MRLVSIMKNKGTTTGLLLVTSCVMLFASCAKKQSPQTPFNKIQGKWKLIQTATDDNANGQIDPSEIHSVPAGQDNEIKFNNDETGVETNTFNGVVSSPLNFRWKIVGADSVQIAYVAHDTATYYVSDVSASNLTLTTNGQSGLVWFNYIKD